VRQRLADPAHRPQPVQQPVPLLVGAMSTPTLSVAARHAEIVGFSGLRHVPGTPVGTFTVCSAAEMAQRVEEVRRQAGGRPYRSDVLLPWVVIGRDPEEAATEIAAASGGHLTVAQLLDTPFALLAQDVSHAVAELRRRQRVYGFDSVATRQPYLEALGEVIAAWKLGDGQDTGHVGMP
jgi:alkanesulfonate monooxygenase SsuD/methylene tetrahydromethanopterin reductase-like flavin-dependent oxidoreductase (luciferase family)